jgi:CysZ protein
VADPVDSRTSGSRSFLGGVGDFLRGFRVWGTSPGLMALGAVPALIVGVVVLALLTLLALNLPVLTEWLTPFAQDWDELWRSSVRLAVAAALFVIAVLLAVSTFTALTLAVGDPFYERIWLGAERRLGSFDEPKELGFWPSLRRGIASGSRLVGLSVLLGIAVFALGLVPVVGGVLGFALGAVGGGWLIAAELLARPFDSRAIDSREQRRLRRRSTGRVLGFGVAVYVLFLLPFGALFATPAAVAGSAVLARRLLEHRVTGAGGGTSVRAS